jgi:hypothetical protein
MCFVARHVHEAALAPPMLTKSRKSREYGGNFNVSFKSKLEITGGESQLHRAFES